MKVRRLATAVCTTAVLTLAAPTAPALAGRAPDTPQVRPLATFGSGLGSGSTIGPDGALYVTDGNAGSIVRIDTRTGVSRTYASGLPPQVLGIGGAMDVAFVGRTAYVLVTMVGGDLLLPGGAVHFGDATVGIYRLERDGRFTVVADIGAWSAAHPPTTSYFITTGVHYSLDRWRDGFVVADGHHNRVLRVGLDGSVGELAVFGNVVPTGLETHGGTVYVAQAGPVPHRAADAKVVALRGRSQAPTLVGSGRPGERAGLAVDVERGGRDLYALLQGVWDLPVSPENEGAPASADSGALVRIGPDGAYRTVVAGLDRPTSVEFVGDTAFVVGLGGTVVRIDGATGGSGGHDRDDHDERD